MTAWMYVRCREIVAGSREEAAMEALFVPCPPPGVLDSSGSHTRKTDEMPSLLFVSTSMLDEPEKIAGL